jgi:hypothetical protein
VKLLYNVDQAARRLGLTPGEIIWKMSRGQLPSERLGKRRLIPAAAIDALLREHSQANSNSSKVSESKRLNRAGHSKETQTLVSTTHLSDSFPAKSQGGRPRKAVPSSPSSPFDSLSTRTHNCLRQAAIFTVSQLEAQTEEQLLEIPNFGKKCLDEVKVFLSMHGHSLSKSERGCAALSEQTRDQLSKASISSLEDLLGQPLEDLLSIPGLGSEGFDEVLKLLSQRGIPHPKSLESLLKLLALSSFVRNRLQETMDPYLDTALHLVTQCQYKVEYQVKQGILDDRAAMDWHPVQSCNQGLRPPAHTLTELLYSLQYMPNLKILSLIEKLNEALAASTLDDELAQLLSQLDDRTLRTLRGRFAVGKHQTLEQLSKEFGVTRERVRQISLQAAEKLRQSYYFEQPLPRLRTSMLLVRRSEAVSLNYIFRLLYERELAVSETTVNDFLAVWRAIDPNESAISNSLVTWRAINPNDYAFPEAILSFTKTGLTRQQQAISKTVLKAARLSTRQTGAVAISQVVDELGDRKVSMEDIIAILSADGMQELVPGYWSRPIGKAVPRTVAAKMLNVCGSLSLRQIRRGLLRHQRRQAYPVLPTAILRAVLEQYDEFSIDQDDVVSLPTTSGHLELGKAERTWLDSVRAYGPVVHTDRIHRTFASNRLRPITAYVLMQSSELVQPISKQLFCLPGACITDADITSGKAQAIKVNANPVLTYDDTGATTLETTVQQYMGRNGSLSSGPAAVMKGSWKAVVGGIQIGEFTVGQPWIYGLDKARDALEMQVGDRIQICFDTWTRQAYISILNRANGY